jgi:hypothetical protein
MKNVNETGLDVKGPVKPRQRHVVEFGVQGAERAAVLDVLQRVGQINEVSAEFVYSRKSYVTNDGVVAEGLAVALRELGVTVSVKSIDLTGMLK